MSHQFTNRLIKETSPYLLQHAHNPVNWFPWGDEALSKARLENKLILVSIGYAACHWCHVMEKESFENETTAKLMNEHFINIKIDREERPDLDHIYMDAVQAISGNGGWPLNVFLTPDAKPFYGGTYFPPVKLYNRSSWSDVLTSLSKAWKERKNEIELQADNLLNHLKQANSFGLYFLEKSESYFTKETCSLITENILKQADKKWGGFGKSPKFPQTFTIQYLLEYYYFTNSNEALQQALLSIDKMLQGGIYDHVGGGFARYSTDSEWLAPHFEKMLYDNALLINILCDAYQITRKKKYKNTVIKTIDFIKRELMDSGGGFYSSLDADSEGIEGKFYVWDKVEIEKILLDDAPMFCEFYDVSDKGNWEHKNILRTLQQLENYATDKGLDAGDVENRLNLCLNKLFAERQKRIRPITDDKILLSGNALMVSALCKAAGAFNNEEYKKLAEDTIHFLQQHFKINNSDVDFYHTYKNGLAKYPAFLDDYAYLVQALIKLQEITSNTTYLYYAKNITEFVIENFIEETSGNFFYTNKNQADVILRKKEVHDGATPSGNSVMAENLLYLSLIFNKPEWNQIAQKNTITLKNAIISYATSFSVWASLLLKYTFGVNELVIIGNNFVALRNELQQYYIPDKVLQCASVQNNDFPMLRDKNPEKSTLIYRCKQYSCLTPVSSVEKLVAEMTEVDKN